MRLSLVSLGLSHSLTATTTAQDPNLWNYGHTGPLLGNSFGTPDTDATYDYVVVGGGNAGLASQTDSRTTTTTASQ